MGVCYATRHDDPSRSRSEWPPHPDRLFSALVAAASSMGKGDELPKSAQEALQWLSEQGAPQLTASRASWRSAPQVHMPTNPHLKESNKNPKGLLPTHRKKASLPIPAAVPENPVVYFSWPNPDAKLKTYSPTLEEVCRNVTYLGRSRSIVSASLTENCPAPTYVPDALGEIRLRVPGSTRLDYLRKKHQDSYQSGKPVPSSTQPYRVNSQAHSSEKALQTVFDRCLIFHPDRGDRELPARSALKVTNALRSALIACIEQDHVNRGLRPVVPDVVHGHGSHPHCAYVVLPYVHPSQPYADGGIKGLAVLLPRQIEIGTLLDLARGFRLLEQRGLGIPQRSGVHVGTWHLQETPADHPPNSTLDAHTWIGPSYIWTTVTPMTFGHFPKTRNGGESAVVLDSVRMLGLDPNRVTDIAVDRFSPLHGVEPTFAFETHRKEAQMHQSPLWLRHVTLRFDQPVRGPMILGSMRYFGLGLMRPLQDWPWPI